MSFRPAVLRRFLELNREINFGPSRLSRLDRELLAVVVSATNRCRYSTLAHVDLLEAEGAPPDIVEHAPHDYRRADLDPSRLALCDFAVTLTRHPATIDESEIEHLRGHGYDDAAIHDAIQVVAFFNYVNRVVDAVGVDDEPEWALTGRAITE
jgi:uncharacterized peroxidase-related enzyme